MNATSLIDDQSAGPEVRALYGEIRANRGTDLINFWRALANDPPTLRRMWESFNATMASGAIDALTKELIFLAVSAPTAVPTALPRMVASPRARACLRKCSTS